jgi:phospholipase C
VAPYDQQRRNGPTARRVMALPRRWPARFRLRHSLIFGLLLSCAQAEVEAQGLPGRLDTATPIRHLVIIFQENTSFDSYFGVYPVALNPPGEPAFEPRPGTPSVNGLTETLLLHNPNASNPFRIGRLDSYTCDQNHDYAAEQRARNGGLMNQYVEFGAEGPGGPGQFCHQNDNGDFDTDLGYFDGNTVTALWNYAQHFALSDNFFAAMSGQSTRGALNLVAGDVFGAVCRPVSPSPPQASIVFVDGGGTVPECNGPVDSSTIAAPPNGTLGTLVDDADPFWDVCSQAHNTVALTGRNVGDLLNESRIPWGWFQGGFTLSQDGTCSSSHPRIAYDLAVGIDPATDPDRLIDYVPHHNPFQYFASTANPRHLPPTSVATVGHTDQANHLYDLSWFWRAAEAGKLPAVSFLKPANYQNGHPGQSDPLDEQVFIVETLNRLQRLPQWRSMAVMIAWDDSDGWYDHVMPPVVNTSATPLDFQCGAASDGPGARCGYGPRLPFLVISPFARENYVSGVLIDQTSMLRFIEDNWLDGERITDISFDNFAGSLEDLLDFAEPNPRKLFLDPMTGQPMSHRR